MSEVLIGMPHVSISGVLVFLPLQHQPHSTDSMSFSQESSIVTLVHS